MGRFIAHPLPVVVHEVEHRAVGLLSMVDEGQIDVEEAQGLRLGILCEVPCHGDDAARIVVCAVAVIAVRDGELGVLDDPGVVGHSPEVVQRRFGHFEDGDCFLGGADDAAGHANWQFFCVEHLPVEPADHRPGHVAPVVIGHPAVRVE